MESQSQRSQGIQHYPGTCLFYDATFRMFCAGQRVALLLIVCEAVHSKVRQRLLSAALCASGLGAALGLLAMAIFLDTHRPNAILLTAIILSVLRKDIIGLIIYTEQNLISHSFHSDIHS